MNTMDLKIGFIGFGSMAQAICDGLLYKNVIKPENIMASGRDQTKLAGNCAKRGINKAPSTADLAKFSDIVVVCVLPQQVRDVVLEAKEELKGKLIFSIAAGIDYAAYISYLGEGYNHISTIPNTPIAIGEGIIIAEETNSLTDEQKAMFEAVFGQVAHIEYFKSELLSLGGTGAGCAPAFVDVFIEALADGLVKNGMSRAQAYRIVPKMIAGTAKFFAQGDKHPGELKDGVCSPGGTTIVGIAALEENGFRYSIMQAVDKIMIKKTEQH